jgi:hypothetical protein
MIERCRGYYKSGDGYFMRYTADSDDCQGGDVELFFLQWRGVRVARYPEEEVD